MNKTNCTTEKLKKGEVSKYDFGGITLYAYKTNDLIDDEVFVVEKDGSGVVIELPCFFDNIGELTAYLNGKGIAVKAKLVAYHGAGASFLPEVPAYSTATAEAYNGEGGGAALIRRFSGVFGDAFDGSVCKADVLMEDGENTVAGIRFIVRSNPEAFDLEIPEINCAYTHMMGHDCHSIVAGCPHADGIISQLNYYIKKGFNFVLTSHYTPEDLKDAKTKIDYLYALKEIALSCESAAEMKQKVEERFPGYSGLNYLDMTVGMFFPA